MVELQTTELIKAYAEQVANSLPERLLKGDKPKSHKARTPAQLADQSYIEQSYSQLNGEWRDWLEVARKYERKVPSLDRYDIRHTILLELNKARQRDGEPLPLLRAYRIASLTVALYWRELNKPLIRVCVISGLAKEPHNAECSYKDKPEDCRQCPFLAVSPIQSLDQPTADSDGNESQLLDTVANDNAIDLDQWLDAKQWLLGCHMRLIEIATKRMDGIPLNEKDRRYFNRQRQKELKRYKVALI
jgi:hypothetical protein